MTHESKAIYHKVMVPPPNHNNLPDMMYKAMKAATFKPIMEEVDRMGLRRIKVGSVLALSENGALNNMGYRNAFVYDNDLVVAVPKDEEGTET